MHTASDSELDPKSNSKGEATTSSKPTESHKEGSVEADVGAKAWLEEYEKESRESIRLAIQLTRDRGHSDEEIRAAILQTGTVSTPEEEDANIFIVSLLSPEIKKLRDAENAPTERMYTYEETLNYELNGIVPDWDEDEKEIRSYLR